MFPMVVVMMTNGALSEIPYDGVDQDGDGVDLVDVDGDGVVGTLAGGRDCADGNGRVYPGATDVVGDRIDADCGGSDGPDRYKHERWPWSGMESRD